MLIRRAFLALAVLIALVAAAPADASPFRLHIRGKAVAGAPNLLPGANAGGAGWTLIAAPAPAGNSGDDGYGDQAIARIDQEPLRVIRTGESFHLGLYAKHTPTFAEYTGGAMSNICEVDFAVDGGSFTPVTSETLNPDTGITDFNINVREADFPTTGKHEVRWKAVPCTGYPLIGQGDWIMADINSGSITGKALSVSGWQGKQTLKVGMGIMGKGILPNTYITADAGGGGGDGAYTVNQSQMISSELMAVNGAPSFIFYSSHSNAVPQQIIYVSTTGNDTTGTGSTSAPFRTIQKAVAPGFGNQNTDEWFICLRTGTYPVTSSGGGGGGPGMGNFNYHLHVLPTTDAPCDGSGPGTVTLDATQGQANLNNLGAVDTLYQHVTIINSQGFKGDDNFGTGATATGSRLIFKNVDFTGLGFNDLDAGVGNATAGLWCLGGTFRNIGNGCNSKIVPLVANATFDHIGVDIASNASFVYGLTITNQGPYPGTGSAVSGSNIVTGLTFNTNLLVVGGSFGTQVNSAFPVPMLCSLAPPYPYTVGSVLSSSSITVSGPSGGVAVASETAASMGAGAGCSHSDQVQLEFDRYNVIVANNDSSAASNNAGRGLANNGTQLHWAIVNNHLAEAGGAKVWEWEAPYMENILVTGNVFDGPTFVNLSSTYVHNYNFNNTCQSAVGRPTGMTFRGGTC
ncbi:hypothetical protein [Phenylobacterium sp.]|uniref:hypothetical protein n=1 Tax=Phenylobacterium sp. TaxID=1871053 RepID=UPI003569469A